MNDQLENSDNPLAGPPEDYMESVLERKISKKMIIIVTLAVVLIILSIGLWVRSRSTNKSSSGTNEQNPTTTNQSETTDKTKLKLIATGDFVFHDSVNAQAKQADGSYNYLQFMGKIKPMFDASDIRFCNQVTPIGGEEFGISGYPKFNAPLDAVSGMASLGCNVVNMASNHSFDKSQAAISANVAAWEKQNDVLAYAGQNRSASEREKVRYFTKDGIKFAFLAYTTYVNGSAPAQNNYGVNVYSRAFAEEQIKEVKANNADIILVSMRWGTEYSGSINTKQEQEAQFLANLGVDVIFGHGPHVLQPVKLLNSTEGKKTIVWYSLGNFLHTQVETETLFNVVAVIDINKDTKRASTTGYVPIYMNYEWTAAQKAASSLLSRKNLELIPLEEATTEMFSNQQISTTKEAQQKRIQKILNQFTKLEPLSLTEYANQ